MMSKFIKVFFKISLISIIILLLVVFAVFAYYYIKINNEYDNLTFDKDKLITATAYAEIHDNEDNVLSNASINGRKTITLDNIPKHTIDAFIAIEDQDFYKHNGLNYKRILKSLLVNIKSGYAKEGASTISQQLIKNTHLNNEKTIERKLKEIFLTRKLEKNFSKNEILEAYLNVIYFGNSCFGIESASNYYFNKSTNELDIAESATLAGIIKSPKLYSPISNTKNCLQRRNLVISQMLECGYITKEQASESTQKELNIVSNNINNSIESATLEFASNNLNLSEKDLVTSNLILKTFINSPLQKYIDDLDLNIFKYDDNMPEYAIIVEDNKSGGIVALRNSPNADIVNMLRQPASCLKPFLVYAPNFEDGKINLLTKIEDKQTNIGGFAPHNAGNKYKGEISIREAISSSSNVCATKLLNYYGITKAKKFAKKFGFDFCEQDNHLALALGSMYEGCSLLTLTNAYSTLATEGEIKSINIIDSISNKDKKITIYKKNKEKKQVISKETAYLVTQALQTCSQNGTAKKLSKYANFVASKTGTNGAYNSELNTDAYCISYSPDYTVCIWMGVKDNNATLMPKTHNGGNQPSAIAKLIWDYIKPNTPFPIPSNIEKIKIDKYCYDNTGLIKLATQDTLDRYTISEYFNKKYAPKLYADTFTHSKLPDFKIQVDGKNVQITLDNLDEFNTYKIYRKKDEEALLIRTIQKEKGKLKYIDENLNKGFYEYYIIANINNKEQKKSEIFKILIE